ncbi:Store-operated calcium entry-associated regulatory factor [Gaertneriomyces sp. JEL0708]|nr:Store-operated calcium entry-associated regulatory factor [Gaertneriomyces sp. JEL0708]
MTRRALESAKLLQQQKVTFGMRTMKILPALLGLLACATATHAASKHQKVLLRDVQTLTLYRGELTTGRRLKPIPEIKCVGGDACKDVVPEVIQCRQVGWNGVDPQWECKTDLEEAWRLGKTDVACEGYSSPDDPYILAGSCGVEYSLYRTQKYVGKSGRHQPGKPHTTEDIKCALRRLLGAMDILDTGRSIVSMELDQK